MPDDKVWTVEAVRAHLEAAVAALGARHDASQAANDTERAYLLETLRLADKRIEARFGGVENLIDREVGNVEKTLRAASDAAALAADKFALATQHRFEGVNEFRGQLADQARTFMPRAEAEAVHGRLSERLQEVGDRLTRIESVQVGRAASVRGLYAALGAATALITAIVIVANVVLR